MVSHEFSVSCLGSHICHERIRQLYESVPHSILLSLVQYCIMWFSMVMAFDSDKHDVRCLSFLCPCCHQCIGSVCVCGGGGGVSAGVTLIWWFSVCT